MTVLLAEEGQRSRLAFAPRSPHAQPLENKRPCFILVFFVCFNLLLGWEGNSSRSSESPLILLHHNICLFLCHLYQLKNAVIVAILINR